MANRYRNNGIYLMLSDDELEILNKKYELSGCKTLRQFIMKCLFEKDITLSCLNISLSALSKTPLSQYTSNGF